MRYLEPSFSVPPAKLKTGKNTHGQTWEDIFNTHPKTCSCRGATFHNGEVVKFADAESVPDATGNDLPLASDWAEHA